MRSDPCLAPASPNYFWRHRQSRAQPSAQHRTEITPWKRAGSQAWSRNGLDYSALASSRTEGDEDVAAHSWSLPVHKRCLSKTAPGTVVAMVPSSGNCLNLHRKVKLTASTSPSLYFCLIKKNQILISILNRVYQSQMSPMETNKI